MFTGHVPKLGSTNQEGGQQIHVTHAARHATSPEPCGLSKPQSCRRHTPSLESRVAVGALVNHRPKPVLSAKLKPRASRKAPVVRFQTGQGQFILLFLCRILHNVLIEIRLVHLPSLRLGKIAAWYHLIYKILFTRFDASFHAYGATETTAIAQKDRRTLDICFSKRSPLFYNSPGECGYTMNVYGLPLVWFFAAMGDIERQSYPAELRILSPRRSIEIVSVECSEYASCREPFLPNQKVTCTTLGWRWLWVQIFEVGSKGLIPLTVSGR